MIQFREYKLCMVSWYFCWTHEGFGVLVYLKENANVILYFPNYQETNKEKNN